MSQTYDVVVVGGGHNGLVAAAYLAHGGLRTVVLEAGDRVGGAVAGSRPFPGVDVALSRYSYLVSLFPASILSDLRLDLELRSRRVASYTPVRDGGLLVERDPGPATAESFRALTGSESEYGAWRRFYSRLKDLARVVEPTLTGPLPRGADLRVQIDPDVWAEVVEQPIGRVIERFFADDTVRGVVLTDALIGTDSHAHDETLRQNRCFLYHVIGQGTGEWRVPVGGMGRLAGALETAAVRAGAELRTRARVVALRSGGDGVEVETEDGVRLLGRWVLANCAPSVLAELIGARAADRPAGNQTKINLVLRRLPRFRSGIEPSTGFAGTLHLAQGYRRLDETYAQAHAGALPDPMPCEVYCHTLTDDTILSPELRTSGHHTLTLFGLNTPADLFRTDPDGSRSRAEAAALRSLQDVLDEPLEDCLAVDGAGRRCVEVKTPLDIEVDLGMPGGHIFHGDLSWPWLADGEEPTTSADRWGVATPYDRVLLCGSGSRRGGAVSGLGGHSAAMAVLQDA